MSYRKLALKSYPHCCDICNYCTYVQVLEVHHVDFDHNNNSIHNLQILCPTCHKEIHVMNKQMTETDMIEIEALINSNDW